MARIHPTLMMTPAILLGLVAASPTTSPQEQLQPPEAARAAIACRALEVKTAEKMGVTLVLFHQASKTDGSRLGELLRANDGASVEFETSDGRSHPATLFRMGTCFGRGLLVFPAGSARLSPHEQFWLRLLGAKTPQPSPR